jgi:hypothetical protein
MPQAGALKEAGDSFMQGLLVCGILGLAAMGAEDNPAGEPTWLKDLAAAKAKALREQKPIFAVFR